MTKNIKQAVIFGVGLALGMALGQGAFNWAKNKIS